MTRTTDTTNEKAPGTINTEVLATETTTDPNFATGMRHSKAITKLVAELAIRGHAVYPLIDGGFLVCKYGHTFHANDYAELQAFARRWGVSNV